MDTTTQWVLEHGCPALFGLLALGVVGAPIPDETLLVLTGAMVARGQLPAAAVLAAALGGSTVGITVSYVIGRFAGRWLTGGQRGWRRRVAVGIERGTEWFHSHGPMALSGGYFLPGVRHLTGIAAGALQLPYRTFALYAYAGALLWTLTFLAIGWFAGEEWERVTGMVDSHLRLLKPAFLLVSLVCLLLWIRSHGGVSPAEHESLRKQ